MRKAQGLSMNVIVISAIALVVMIILIVIFIGKARSFGSGVASCTDKGGKCEASFTACLNKDGVTISGTKCDESGEVCCLIREKEGE